VAAIFGPGTQQTAGIATSICAAAEIPHIVTHWDPDLMGIERERYPITINMYPDADVLSRFPIQSLLFFAIR
jgi:ionotropic glutamate receptor